MKRTAQRNSWLAIVAALAFVTYLPNVSAQLILDVVETGGDNEPTDTITAKWTGQTWTVTVNNEPLNGLLIGDLYTASGFGSGVPAYVDRNHVYLNDPTNSLSVIPSYLLGGEYILSGNDNRDNATYQLSVTLSGPAIGYMLIDNRLSDGDNLTPPTFGPTSMQWILDQGWTATANGINRFSDPLFPDEVPIDEGANGDIQQYFSVYEKEFAAGTLDLFQADNGGRNMYGVVFQLIPEPSTWALLGLGLGALALARRRAR
ncbi:MAG: PEP-CTERM sorting domain-containing protein [Verrucomicrobia bacterium]|nr:PEP-CTERM sorting domain-containing protein [Verrucomicrobiota bacterium]